VHKSSILIQKLNCILLLSYKFTVYKYNINSAKLSKCKGKQTYEFDLESHEFISLTHGAEPFLRSCQLCSYSRTSQHFMKPEVPVLSQINPIHTIPSYPSKIHFHIVHPPMSWSSQWSPSFDFLTNILYAFFLSPIHATCPTHITLLDLVILIILGEEYKL
jgi:hypothetical protein